MKFFHIPLLGMHIHHRRKASAVTGRETGFEEIHAFNRLIVERREKTANMIHLIDRITIDKKKVLIRISTPNIQTRNTFRPSRHSRCQLQGPDNIGLPNKVGVARIVA